MKSHEVLKGSMEHAGVKTIASDLGVSPSLLYKWCQPGGEPTDKGRPACLTGLPKSSRPRGMSKSFHGFAKKRTVFSAPTPKPTKTRPKIYSLTLKNWSASFRIFCRSYQQAIRRRGDLLQRQPKNSAGMGGLEIGGRILFSAA